MGSEILDLKRVRMVHEHLSIREMADLLGLKLTTTKGWFDRKYATKDAIDSRLPGIGAAVTALANIVETLVDKGYRPDQLSAWFGKRNRHIPGDQRPRFVFKNGHYAEVEAAAQQEDRASVRNAA
jgi:hypothetical protein